MWSVLSAFNQSESVSQSEREREIKRERERERESSLTGFLFVAAGRLASFGPFWTIGEGSEVRSYGQTLELPVLALTVTFAYSLT